MSEQLISMKSYQKIVERNAKLTKENEELKAELMYAEDAKDDYKNQLQIAVAGLIDTKKQLEAKSQLDNSASTSHCECKNTEFTICNVCGGLLVKPQLATEEEIYEILWKYNTTGVATEETILRRQAKALVGKVGRKE